MTRDDIFASLAVLVLAGAIVFCYRQPAPPVELTGSAATVEEAGGSVEAFLAGPAIYVANTPYLFQAPAGNVLPQMSASNTLPGSQGGDLLNWNAPASYSA